jgi:hypothetical protein
MSVLPRFSYVPVRQSAGSLQIYGSETLKVLRMTLNLTGCDTFRQRSFFVKKDLQYSRIPVDKGSYLNFVSHRKLHEVEEFPVLCSFGATDVFSPEQVDHHHLFSFSLSDSSSLSRWTPVFLPLRAPIFIKSSARFLNPLRAFLHTCVASVLL